MPSNVGENSRRNSILKNEVKPWTTSSHARTFLGGGGRGYSPSSPPFVKKM